jgi:hypothetical protein
MPHRPPIRRGEIIGERVDHRVTCATWGRCSSTPRRCRIRGKTGRSRWRQSPQRKGPLQGGPVIRLKFRDFAPSPFPRRHKNGAPVRLRCRCGPDEGSTTMVPGTGYLMIGVVAFAVGIAMLVIETLSAVPP